MTYETYKFIHLVGIIMVVLSLGGIIMRNAMKPESRKWRVVISMTHGLGLLIMLVAGFGALAKTSGGFPLWAQIKFAIWIVFGALLVVSNKRPKWSIWLWLTVIVLGAIAAWIARFKPFV